MADSDEIVSSSSSHEDRDEPEIKSSKVKILKHSNVTRSDKYSRTASSEREHDTSSRRVSKSRHSRLHEGGRRKKQKLIPERESNDKSDGRKRHWSDEYDDDKKEKSSRKSKKHRSHRHVRHGKRSPEEICEQGTTDKDVTVVESSPAVLGNKEYELQGGEDVDEQTQNTNRLSARSLIDKCSSKESNSSHTSRDEEEAMKTNFCEKMTCSTFTSDNIEDDDCDINSDDESLPSYFPAIQGCRSVDEFQCVNRIEEGAYGVVYRAREKRTNRVVAMKRLKLERERDGFPITSLREINTLLKAAHPNIVNVNEIVIGDNKIFIVMDHVEHDLKSLMDTMKKQKKRFTLSEVKGLMLQLLKAVNHLHDNWILHRDLKPSNLLCTRSGVLKICDFGLAREYGSPLKPYTPLVVTQWYRAPELLLGAEKYCTNIDMWSVGCIFGELLCMEPLFPGKSEPDQLKLIFKALGTPNRRLWPEYPELPAVRMATFSEYPPHGVRGKFVPSILSPVGYNLLTSFLCYDPKKRITAEDALLHEHFSETPLPFDPSTVTCEDYWNTISSDDVKPSHDDERSEQENRFYIATVGEHANHPAGFNVESTFTLKF